MGKQRWQSHRWVVLAGVLLSVQASQGANLIGEWTFNETAEDLTGNGNNVVFVGDPSFVSTGSLNSGINLNSSAGQYVDYGSSPLFGLTTAFSLEAWVTIKSLPAAGSEPLIFGKDHTLFGITYYANGNSYSYVGGGTNTVAVPLALNQAYHLVETWDGSTIRVYRNGAQVGSLSSSTPPPANGGNNLLSGRPGPSDGNAFLNAIIDETRIYSGALTAAEVTASFQAGPTQIQPRWISQSGDWHTTSNWVGGIPNSAGAIANFTNDFAAPSTIVIDQPALVGKLSFDSVNRVVLAGSSTLSIQTSVGQGTILVAQGGHAVNLPLFFKSDSQIAVSNGGTLTLGNPVTISAGKTVTAAGNLRVEAPLILEPGASLVIGSGATSLRGLPAISGGAGVELRNGTLSLSHVDSSTADESIRLMLQNGDIRSGDDSGSTAVGWQTDSTQNSVSLQLTYLGDADLNRTVDSIDFSHFAANYGLKFDGTWSAGDFDYDGRVTTADFNLLAGSFGRSMSPTLLGSTVPEPASISAFIAIAGFWSRNRGR